MLYTLVVIRNEDETYLSVLYMHKIEPLTNFECSSQIKTEKQIGTAVNLDRCDFKRDGPHLSHHHSLFISALPPRTLT